MWCFRRFMTSVLGEACPAWQWSFLGSSDGVATHQTSLSLDRCRMFGEHRPTFRECSGRRQVLPLVVLFALCAHPDKGYDIKNCYVVTRASYNNRFQARSSLSAWGKSRWKFIAQAFIFALFSAVASKAGTWAVNVFLAVCVLCVWCGLAAGPVINRGRFYRCIVRFRRYPGFCRRPGT